ncbi:MAG: tRNA (adenosine(37)-N6)-dimethylallyltransferase MiaA, partial [Clostridia bacterium]|nr:tRNA (adenosine(37)-N6)-dimethylallyltransferase MiaA [Clostridia bacterium]
AHGVISEIYKRGHLPIVAGGTGLYIDSLVNDEDFSSVGENETLRKELSSLAEKEGNEAVYSILKKLDLSAAENLHPNNLKRVIRAIEVIKTTGKSLEESIKREKAESRYDVLYLVLSHDREVLYDRIEKRVDIMMKEGLLDEAKWLFDTIENESATSLQAIGYKEFKGYFEGKKTLEEAIDELKKDTRHYAKRQMTWFRRNKDAKLINCGNAPFVQAEELVSEFLSERTEI